MKHTTLKTLIAIGAFTNCTVPDESKPVSDKHPNILLIIADDLGTDALSIYNQGKATTANTPNLDRLSESGVTFTNAWGASLSSPSRACMLTGRYGFRTDVIDLNTDLPSDEISIQNYLSKETNNEYSNAIIGKWHLSKDINSPESFGVEHFAGFMGGGVRDYNRWQLIVNGETKQQSEYITTKLTDLATEWINEQEKPWFCWLAYPAPHTPLHLPPTYMHTQGELPTDSESIKANPLPYFLAMIESMDYEIGRLLDEIDAEELKNTIIIFVGDNGTDLNVIQSPYTREQGKGSLYEGGVRVPLIVSGVGVTRSGERDENLICATDIFSTIVELAGVEQSTYHDSYSFKPLLTSIAEGDRHYSFTEIIGRASGYGNAIRNDKYKLISIKDGQTMLFDLENDPYEKNNLLLGELNKEQQMANEELSKELNNLNINISDEKIKKAKTMRTSRKRSNNGMQRMQKR